ncbi:mediator of RNA polymerase II transcription subunit 15 isoform X1 [Odontomachus brunneus]|uniref:mediator of RNA polymerase II transcription subunit 15 isoform X1 n=1 Tax=Odontomachus brunneus TaxID=486640 RepID=UPI0013F1A2B0|nr:mediator of RNA polymerase II transcription subunit 15 isoform X1 [Odontomachus brunneus]XP_032679690.1 mediator of RNA polymerase II transcription subunit 15 isoform X1 [Odontomachus brunneus]XP_032679691.1 mediator of RNA polymerase II transcription subunit 15 isoform X1 [Odontomachus brunneus]XP_032679692.1 mediator of RNA polymerase II transcription subunit 15 isoform X1 [Odontomachus brunneus]XP_032679693.1 mediator of RNA polymerase II transcription subunit 15 isoform X1 [Odontomachus 
MKNNNVYHVKYANMENQRDFDSSQHVPRMLMSQPQFPSPPQMATVSSSAQQPVNVQQPINFQQISRIVRLTTPQHTTNLRLSRVRKFRSGQQSTNVQLAHIPQLVNIQQPANVQQPVSVQQSASVQPVIVQQPVNVQQPAGIPQSANIQQRASVQQPVSVQQSASVQQPVNVQPMSIQQPVIGQQSMHVQRLKSVLRTPSVNNSSSKQIIVGNVMIPLNQAQLQRLKNNNKLKQDGTGSLEMHVQNDKRIKFVYKPNVLQTLNQRPGQPMNMPGMQNKMPGMNMMPAQTGGPMSHMGPIQTMQNNPMLTQMNQMGQGNMPQQMNQIVPGQMNQLATGQMQQNMQSQMQNQLPGQMGNQIGGPIGGIQTSMPQQMTQIGPGQLGPGQMQQQLNHIQRKPGEMMNTGFPGPRNVAPNQFLRQSPSPSAPSPAGLGAPSSNQMVASPALVPSPSPQHGIMTGPSRSVNSVGMAPSPSSSLNTPGGVGATPSPQQEDQAYRDKVRQLSKYIEPLRRMIAKMGSEGNVDKLSKMKKLLEILSNPSKRMPLDTLLKCEVVLEKLDFKRGDGSVGPPVTTLKEHQIFSPLLEAVSAHLQSPVINHTLQRTFGPYLGALFAPEIKNLPPPMKKQKVEEPPSEIPDVLQGEIARLDQRFKVSLDPAQQNGSKCIQLICWLDDRHLPCVPPVSVTVPADYPVTPPRCVMAPHEYEATTFLCAVQKALNARIAKLPRRFSLSQLLDTWEMSVRQASAPTQVTVTASTVLMGL